MRILVTGAAGFLGSYFTEAALQRGWEVFGLDAVADDLAPKCLVSYHRLNLPSSELGELIHSIRPELCLHAAGTASVQDSIIDPDADFRNGPLATFCLLDTLRRHAGNCRVVITSSAAIYGNPGELPVNEFQAARPLSPYGFHKLMCEAICEEHSRLYGLATASVRIFSAYGPGLRKQVVWDICRKALKNSKLQLMGDGRESRDFIHVKDVCQGILLVAERGRLEGEAYNLATGQETEIAQLVRLITTALGVERQPSFDGITPKGVPRNWCADISQIRRLGFTPSVSLETGLSETADWCRRTLAGNRTS